MIRVVVYLAIVALLAFGAVWLAERPGDVAIAWQGRRIETSVMVLLSAVAVVAAAAVMLWSIARALVRSPARIGQNLRARRDARGHRAVSRGLIAIGSGDLRAARKFADEASRTAPGEPLTLLLGAQAAQLSGDREGAARTFQAMAGRDDTRLLGLHGLFIEARRRGDPGAALNYAEDAAKGASVPAWAGQAALELRCVAGDWAGALDRLERNMKSGLRDKLAYRRERAVLLTAQALALGDADRERAKTLLLEAVKLAPALVPAAALAGRLLGETGELRKAARIIEAAWRENPHPDLAEAYAYLRPGASARERLTRIQALAFRTPDHIEAALAVARSALDARELAIAREALSAFVAAPTKRVAALMAELEDMAHDEGRAREWMARALHARRDPAWTADGFVSERWLPVSPVSGRLDAFAWKDPLAGEDRPMIAAQVRPALDAPRPPPAAEAAPAVEEAEPADDIPPPEPPRREEPEPAPEPPPSLEPRRPLARSLTPVPVVPAVIPLVHAPDDPGPDPEPNSEPAPGAADEQASEGWNRIRRLLKP